jgi:hypothetical protein
MGLDSNLASARQTFGQARRALMYKPTDLADKSSENIRLDMEMIAREYGPCDIVLADIEAGTPDRRVLELLKMCREIERHFD